MRFGGRLVRKLFWDLGRGGRGIDLLFGFALVGAAVGALAGWLVGSGSVGAGVGALAGLVAFAVVVLWAHWAAGPRSGVTR